MIVCSNMMDSGQKMVIMVTAAYHGCFGWFSRESYSRTGTYVADRPVTSTLMLFLQSGQLALLLSWFSNI